MKQLWAPWRLEYIQNSEKREGCFLCDAWKEPGHDRENLVLARGKLASVIINRYPYNSSHLMVAPARHIGQIEEANPDEAAEIWGLITTCKLILHEILNTEGTNIGINQGLCAGAGVRDHLHVHVVPRWEGDTNFMPVIADVKVMPESLEACYDKLRPAFAQKGL